MRHSPGFLIREFKLQKGGLARVHRRSKLSVNPELRDQRLRMNSRCAKRKRTKE
jgi:hypothetical protein